MEKKTKTFISNGAKSAGAEGQGSAIISTGSPDRDKDRLMPAGVRLDNYRRNPVVLFGHDHRALPVGKNAIVTVGELDIRARWSWLEHDEFAGRVRNAWDQGALSATSVGFTPLKYKDNDIGGYDFTEWELMEFSIVPVPSNPEALALRTVKSLNEDLQRRLRGAPGDDDVVLRLIDDVDDDELINCDFTFAELHNIVKAELHNIVKAELHNLKGVVADRAKSMRPRSREEQLKDELGVTPQELQAIVRTACQEFAMALTGRLPD